jgi:hypothetical protein
MAGRRHSGDRAKSCLIVGDTLGLKCFSDECEAYRIGDLLRRLNEDYEPYADIFAEDDGVPGLDVEEIVAAPTARRQQKHAPENLDRSHPLKSASLLMPLRS